MAYDKEKILRSELAYKVVREISKSEDGLYTKELAERLDSSSTSISNIIKELRNLNVLERGKRTKAQYYDVNYSGFADIQNNIIEENKIDPLTEVASDTFDSNNIEESPEKVRELVTGYCKNYLEENSSSNIEKMILKDYYMGLMELIVHDEHLENSWLYPHYSKLSLSLGTHNKPSNLLRKSLEEI
jgi:DNA-binding transcriptional regulator GbsR (MarR family)